VHSSLNPSGAMPDIAVRYTLNPGLSRFKVQATASGLLSAFAHNPVILIPAFSGEVRFDPASLDSAYLRMVIDAGALDVSDDMNDKDREEIRRLMYEEVLDSGSYPELIYECSSVTGSSVGQGRFWLTLNGELTLHGVTRPQPVGATLAVDHKTLRASGDFSLRQSDYQIKLVSSIGGALKVKDELRCSFNIVAEKSE
jgi:polyisoprenoid-binding protein YceI